MGHFGWPQVGHFQPILRDEKENKVGYFEVAIGGVFSSGHPGGTERQGRIL